MSHELKSLILACLPRFLGVLEADVVLECGPEERDVKLAAMIAEARDVALEGAQVSIDERARWENRTIAERRSSYDALMPKLASFHSDTARMLELAQVEIEINATDWPDALRYVHKAVCAEVEVRRCHVAYRPSRYGALYPRETETFAEWCETTQRHLENAVTYDQGQLVRCDRLITRDVALLSAAFELIDATSQP